MKITVLTGSPRKNGTSNFLADEFIKGAQENGHEIFRFDCAKADVKNCIACQACAMGSKPCIHKDDFVELREQLLSSDMVVFVTPIYYFNMTSSIKKVIDRFYSIDPQIKAKNMKSALISVQHSPVEVVNKALNENYIAIASWLNFNNTGIVNAIGIESVEHLKQTPYPKQAYDFGKSL